jgi:hypothetical protein
MDISTGLYFYIFIFLQKKLHNIYNKVPVLLHYRYAGSMFPPLQTLFEQGAKKGAYRTQQTEILKKITITFHRS